MTTTRRDGMNAAAALRRAIAAHESALVDLRQTLADIEGAPDDFPLSVKQAAYLVNIPARTLYRHARLIGVRVGREWRICPKLLAAEMANDGEGRHTETDENQLRSKGSRDDDGK